MLIRAILHNISKTVLEKILLKILSTFTLLEFFPNMPGLKKTKKTKQTKTHVQTPERQLL